MGLYEVAILEHPIKETDNAKLVFGPVAVVAKDREGAILSAGSQYLGADGPRLEVLVRPFGTDR